MPVENCVRAGVRIGFGTDLLGTLHGREAYELVLRSQVSGSLETLRSATSVNADLMNLGGQVGTIASGAYADLLLIDGDPLTDISILTRPQETIKLIMLEGKIITNRLEARAVS